jgi:omega-6 fatty acid desaturase (delta-12 desaturase)
MVSGMYTHQYIYISMNEARLFQKHKSTYGSAFHDLTLHTFLLWMGFYITYLFRESYICIAPITFLSFMLDRTFIVFHDFGHGSYVPNKRLNYLIGSIMGIFVTTPFSWNYTHHNHHKTSGNTENELQHRAAETIYHTVSQYRNMSRTKRTLYRVLRNPFIFHTITPIIYWGIKQRYSVLVKKLRGVPFEESVARICFDLVVSNLGIFLLGSTLYRYGILAHWMVALWLFGIKTVIVFHNEHVFNPPYMVKNDTWTQRNSGLIGSSLICFPEWIKYFMTGNGIPSYSPYEFQNSRKESSCLPRRSGCE